MDDGGNLSDHKHKLQTVPLQILAYSFITKPNLFSESVVFIFRCVSQVYFFLLTAGTVLAVQPHKRGLEDEFGYEAGQVEDSHGPSATSYFSGTFGSPHKNVKTVVLTKEVKVPVPQPYPVTVEKNVPYPVKVPVEVKVEKPVPVHVEKPYPVYVERKVPYAVEKHVPYPVEVPIKVPVPVPHTVHVPKPYPVHIPKPVPVPHPVYIEKNVPVYIKKEDGTQESEGFDSFGGEEDHY